MDTAYNVFAGLIMMYHTNKNPIVITFLSILLGSHSIKNKIQKNDIEDSGISNSQGPVWNNWLVRKF